MDSLSDGQLLARFRGDRDTGAFAALVERHQAGLFRHVRALLGEGTTCEDVVQETFLKLAQKPPVLPPEADGRPDSERAHLLAWLHKVARNGCMDVMRKESRRREREEAVAAHEATRGGQLDVDAGDTRAAIERTLQELPADQREVLVLRLLGDRSYREISEVTGKKIGTVGWLVSTGLRALGQKLEPLLGVEGTDEQAGTTGGGALRGGV